MKRPLANLPLHPPLVAAAGVLALFAASPALLDILWRPLAIAVIGAAALQLIASVLVRNRYLGAVIATLAILVLAGLWPIALAALIPIVWAALRRALGREVALPSPRRVSAILNVAALIAVATSALTVVASDPGRLLQAQERAEIGIPAPGAPDIYVLWLDGYPRADSLEELFSFDNEPFLRALEDRGFDVARQSRSNYSATWLTMSSMLHMQYVADIPHLVEPADDPVGQFKQLRRAVNAAPVMDELRARGYTVATSVSPFSDAGFSNAEIVLDDGSLNQFEEQLMRLTHAGRVLDLVAPDWFAAQARQRVLSSFDHLRRIVHRSEPAGPVVTLAHIFAPHAPFVWAPDGPRPAPACHPASCFLWETEIGDLGIEEEDYAGRLREYVAFTNRLVLDAIDDVIQTRPDAVLVLVSDHGTRYSDENQAEQFRNLFAARTPGASAVFDDDTSPVNVFRRLFSAYFDMSLADLPYEAWSSRTSAPLHLDRFGEVDR